MKFNLSWLKEFINLKQDPQKIGEMLTLIGLEVDSLTPLEKGDYLFEVAITPNLIFANSLLGIAKELSALTGEKVISPKLSKREEKEVDVRIEIENKDLCPRYACLIFDVNVVDSPEWLKERLILAGFRPKNIVVDVTNYVMHELGHPLHAFDFDKIEGKKIIVREAKKDEKIVLLDEKEVYLLPDTLVIADAKKPLAIAGIMGGKVAEVNEGTTRVLVEAAYFDPKSIRRSSKKLGISSTASFYFERGTDPNALTIALERVRTLLQDCGTSFSKIIDKTSHIFTPKKISCRLSRVNRVLGTKLALSEVETLFLRLGFETKLEKDETLVVTVPTYRNDIKEEIDLVEEVARLYGYNNIFSRNQEVTYQNSSIDHTPFYTYFKQIRHILLGEGLQEILTCNLISPEEADVVSPAIFPSRTLIKILNPTSLIHSVMRPSLLPNALSVIKENVNHDITSLACFELGKVYFKKKDGLAEPFALALYLTGKRCPHPFVSWDQPLDFFDLKGILENLFLALKIDNISFVSSHFKNFHPSRQAVLTIGQKQEMGIMGELHPSFLEMFGLKEPVFYAELDLDSIYPLVNKEVRMKPLPLFPSSTRDWTLTVNKEFSAQDLLNLVHSIPSKILEEVLLLDVYQSDKLASLTKNVTLRFIYRDLEKTLSFEEVEKEHKKMTEGVLKRVNL